MMVLDTNVVIRYLIKDDKQQAVLAYELLARHECFILKTVLLETAWVLSSKVGYSLPKEHVVERLTHLMGLPNVFMEDAEQAFTALKWYEKGMDFADALHLATQQPQDVFATFDKKMASKAQDMADQYRLLLLQ